MTRDEILKMAREAGFANVRGGLMDNGEISDYWDCWPGQLERFARAAYEAGAAAEREACAKVCEDYTDNGGGTFVDHEGHGHELAQRIRARGEK